jgi:rhodanese-related sulfurtransferase
MSKRYIILAILLIGLAFVLTRLPEKPKRQALSPEQFLIEINDPARYLSTDLVAKRMIERDPGLFLIDVRTADQHEEYTLPGSVNIPLDEILNAAWVDYLDQDAVDIVFYSNADIYADQAWALSIQKGYNNLYVMKGGVNEWFKTIMQPVYPLETSPSEDFTKYSFRKGASQYFGGTPSEASSEAPIKKKEVTIHKKKKKEAEGGC